MAKSKKPKKKAMRAKGKRKLVYGALRPGIVAILKRTRAGLAESNAVIAEVGPVPDVAPSEVEPLLHPERYGFAEPRYNSNPRTVTFTLTRTEDRDDESPVLDEEIGTPSIEIIGPYTAEMLQDPIETADTVPIVIGDDLYQRIALRAFHDRVEMSDIVEKAVAKMPRTPLVRCACCAGACHHPVAYKPRNRTRFRCGCDQVITRAIEYDPMAP